MKKIQTPMNRSIGTHCSTMASQELVSGGLTSIFTPRSLSDLTRAGDVVPLEGDLTDLPGLDLLEEIREHDLAPGRLILLEELEKEDDDEADHHPQGEVLVERIHSGNHTIRREAVRAGRPEGDQLV